MPTPTSSIRWPTICWTTPSSSPRQAAPSASGWRGWPGGGSLHLELRPGISPEALPYVFQRFYKEDQSRGLHARGAGLGLNICKVLVNLSGGQIRVESKQGEWCRFVFTLPVQPPNPGGMKRLPDESGRPGAVEDPASMKPVD